MKLLKKIFGGSELTPETPKPDVDNRPAATPRMMLLILKRNRGGLTKEEEDELQQITKELYD